MACVGGWTASHHHGYWGTHRHPPSPRLRRGDSPRGGASKEPEQVCSLGGVGGVGLCVPLATPEVPTLTVALGGSLSSSRWPVSPSVLLPVPGGCGGTCWEPQRKWVRTPVLPPAL